MRERCSRTVRVTVMVTEEDAADLRALAAGWNVTLSTLVWSMVADRLWAMRGRRERERWRTSEGMLREVLARLTGGLRPSRAVKYVRSKAAERQARYRERQRERAA